MNFYNINQFLNDSLTFLIKNIENNLKKNINFKKL